MSKNIHTKHAGHEHGANMGIRGRLMMGFATVVSVFFISVLVSLYYMNIVKRDSYEFVTLQMPASHAMIDLQAELVGLRVDVQELLLRKMDSKKVIDDDFVAIAKLIERADSDIKAIGNVETSSDWDHLKSSLNAYLIKMKDVVKMYESGKLDEAKQIYIDVIIGETKKINTLLNNDVVQARGEAGLQDDLNELLTASISDINRQINFLFYLTIIFLISAVIISYIASILTARSIVNPLRYAIIIADSVAAGEREIDIAINRNDETGLLLKSLDSMRNSIKDSEEKIKKTAEENIKLYDSVVKAANMFSQHSGRVASGDLTKRLDLKSGGIDQEAMTKLGSDLNQMTDNLSAVTKDIIMACSSMVSTLDEVRHAVDAQSSGASEQASSINQITASITEIEKSATQTMNKAKDLGSVAEKTRQSGQHGLESIESSVLGMKSVKDKVQLIAQTILDLSRQTQQVGEITSVVNNLAQQSKMLALNASIEAAKAGEAGKGFAVVAAEVKNLAEQSEQSTSQVQKILEDIRVATEKAVMVTEEGTKGVDSGLQMIEKTGEVIRELNEVIREATIASQQIEAAVRQESAGIEQITAGMNEINTVTASFVESVNQTTEAMDDLSTVTNKLKSSVETYKV